MKTGRKKAVLLGPNEKEKVYWDVELREGLQEGFVYTFPVNIEGDRGISASTQFKAESGLENYRSEDFKVIRNGEKEEKPYSRQVNLGCSGKNVYLSNQVKVSCDVENQGDQDLKDLQVCHKECRSLNLGAGESKQVNFERSFEYPGVKNIVVQARNDMVSKTTYTKLRVLDQTGVNLTLEVPERVKLGKDAGINISLNKTSVSTPKNLEVVFSFQGSQRTWKLDYLENPKEFKINLGTDSFTFTNEFRVEATYEDELGKQYRISDQAKVKLDDVGFRQWFRVALNTLGYKAIQLFT